MAGLLDTIASSVIGGNVPVLNSGTGASAGNNFIGQGLKALNGLVSGDRSQIITSLTSLIPGTVNIPQAARNALQSLASTTADGSLSLKEMLGAIGSAAPELKSAMDMIANGAAVAGVNVNALVGAAGRQAIQSLAALPAQATAAQIADALAPLFGGQSHGSGSLVGTGTSGSTSSADPQGGGPILVASNGSLPIGNSLQIAQNSSSVPSWFQPLAPGGARPFMNSLVPPQDITANYPQAASVVTGMFGAANIVPNALTATITDSGITNVAQRAQSGQPFLVGAASLDGNRNLTKVDMDRGASDFMADLWYRGSSPVPLGSGQTPTPAQQQWRNTFFEAYLAQEVAHQVTFTLPYANNMNATEGEIIGESASLQVTPAYASETLWRAMAHELRGGNRAGAPAYGGITDVTKYALGQAIIQAGGGGGSTDPYQVGDDAFAQMQSIVGNVPRNSSPRVIVDAFLNNLGVNLATFETYMVDAFKNESTAILNSAPNRSGAPTTYTPSSFQR